MNTKKGIFICMFVFLCLNFALIAQAESEPNNNFADANHVPASGTFTGTMSNNHDYYVFDLEMAGALSLKVTRTAADPSLPVTLYNSDQKTLLKINIGINTTEKSCTLYLPKGTYYLLFGYSSSAQGSWDYTVQTQFTPKLVTRPEPKYDWTKAPQIVFGTAYSAVSSLSPTSSSNYGMDDYYKLVVPSDGTVTVEASSYADNGSSQIILAKESDPTNPYFWFTNHDDWSESGDGTKEGTFRIPLEKGVYYLRFRNTVFRSTQGITTVGGVYSFTAAYSSGDDGSGSASKEDPSPQTPSDSQPIQTTRVKLNASKKTLVLGKSCTLKASLTPSNADNKKVTWTSSNKKVATVSAKGVVTAKGIGQATITVKTKDTGKRATCKITVRPSAPKITVKQTGSKIRVSWKKVKGASGYKIYRSVKKNSGYRLVRTLNRASARFFTDRVSGLKNKKRYYYKVVAYKTVKKSKINSSYSKPASIRVKK